MKHKESMSKWQ